MTQHTITDLPNFDVLKRLPAWAEIRIGDGLLVLWNPKHEIWCSTELYQLTPDIIRPMIGNLAGAIFEKEYPGKYCALIKLEAEMAVQGLPLPPEEAKIRGRLDQLLREACVDGYV